MPFTYQSAVCQFIRKLLNHERILCHLTAFLYKRPELDKTADALARHVLQLENIELSRAGDRQI